MFDTKSFTRIFGDPSLPVVYVGLFFLSTRSENLGKTQLNMVAMTLRLVPVLYRATEIALLRLGIKIIIESEAEEYIQSGCRRFRTRTGPNDRTTQRSPHQ